MLNEIEVRHKRSQIVGFQCYEMSRLGKSIENKEQLLSGYRVSFGGEVAGKL